jgi:large subunit ribosomal protein L4
MYRAAMRSILAELSRQGRVHIAEMPTMDAPKTKTLRGVLDGLGISEALILVDEAQDVLALSARNLKDVELGTAAGIDPVSLVAYEHLVVTEAALRRLEERFA